MRVLVADDSEFSLGMIKLLLADWGYDVATAMDGDEAWKLIQEPDSPDLLILDWMMPGVPGVEICRMTRASEFAESKYIILLTALKEKEKIIEGLNAGADDYITKPYHLGELRARINTGKRILELRNELSERAKELQDALDHVKTLQGVLPICMHCHKIRNDKDVWIRLEHYVADHTDAKFSHGFCDECYTKFYPETEADKEKKEG